MERWFEIKTPFKVTSEIQVDAAGDVFAIAKAVGIHDPLGLLPSDIAEHRNTAMAKCHPDDEYNRSYGVRLAGNRARIRFYNYVANHVNAKLTQLDQYLCILHNKILKLDEEHEQLLLEQMDIKEPGEIKEG